MKEEKLENRNGNKPKSIDRSSVKIDNLNVKTEVKKTIVLPKNVNK